MNDYRYNLLIDDYHDATKIDDTFLINLYIYFRYGGYYNIIIDDIINIMISIFLMLFIKVIYSCIDFIGLFTNSEEHAITEFINWSKFNHFNTFSCISFVIFIIYIAFKCITTYQNIKKYKKTKHFYNKILKVRDMEIRNYSWEKITQKLISCCHNVSTTNVYSIINRIMKLDNIFISLFDNKILPFKYLNSLTEWNIKYCFLYPLQNNKDSNLTNSIDTNLGNNIDINYTNINGIENTQKYKDEVNKRIFRVGIVNLIFLPFILLFVAFYTIIQYGEKFYNTPSLITSRTWTRTSKWQFRFYNELPHIFEYRMELASKEMKNYFTQFNNRILEIVSRFIVFVISSIFLFLIFIVFINENNLTNKGFFGFQPLLWYITICATILAIFRNFTKSNIMTHPEESLEKANEYLKLISENNIKSANLPQVRNKMATYYKYHIFCLIREVLSITLTPFYYMPKLYNNSNDICEFILKHMETHHIMGNVSKFSIFSKYTQDSIEQHPKLKYSIESFRMNNPNWNINIFDMTPNDNNIDNLELPANSIHESIVTINDSSDETY